MKSPFLPNFLSCNHLALTMDESVIQDQHRRFGDCFGEIIKILCKHGARDGVLSVKAIIFAPWRHHSEKVETVLVPGGHKNLLILKMPTIRHISAGAYMALISKTEVYYPSLPKFYKFLQLKLLELKQLRRGYSPWAFSYPLISCVNKPKKTQKIKQLHPAI